MNCVPNRGTRDICQKMFLMHSPAILSCCRSTHNSRALEGSFDRLLVQANPKHLFASIGFETVVRKLLIQTSELFVYVLNASQVVGVHAWPDPLQKAQEHLRRRWYLRGGHYGWRP